MKARILAWLLAASFCLAGPASAAERTLPGGRFGDVTVATPAGPVKSVALFISGDGGWHLGVVGMARHLVDAGAVVVGIDIRRYLDELGRIEPSGCNDLAVDFERLSHDVQKRLSLPEYRVPVLLGYSSGATLVYAALVQSPPGTFAGGMSLGFCADQDCKGRALCRGTGLHYTPNPRGDFVFEPAPKLEEPWIALQGQQDEVCDAAAVDRFASGIPAARVVRLPKVGHGFGVERNWLPQFLASYQELAERAAPPPAGGADLKDLPLVEVRGRNENQELVVLLTGDGGWAGLDKGITGEFASHGIATVALNSLKYFWTKRTPEEAAQDVSRVIRHYLEAWNKDRVILVGYSFGADVLPFVLDGLSGDVRAKVATVNLLGLSSTATFEVKLSDWIGSGKDGYPIAPEVAALKDPPPMQCLYGEDEKDSLCARLPTNVARQQIGRGHHFSGDYDAIARAILDFSESPHRP
jgi:type IV secretory pathway VirJ component